MWNVVRLVLARVTGDYSSSRGGAAMEMKEMETRELNDLGIGASERPFILAGGHTAVSPVPAEPPEPSALKGPKGLARQPLAGRH